MQGKQFAFSAMTLRISALYRGSQELSNNYRIDLSAINTNDRKLQLVKKSTF